MIIMTIIKLSQYKHFDKGLLQCNATRRNFNSVKLNFWLKIMQVWLQL